MKKTTERSNLIGFFRVHDETSQITATRQAIAFETLASLSGHGELFQPKAQNPKQAGKAAKPLARKQLEARAKANPASHSAQQLSERDFGLSVRIEINLPAQGDQETYDRIFKSIKENLLNG
ncbi:MAG: hypothetical protein ABI481_01265 [Pyrinomonadaceae bacterium]